MRFFMPALIVSALFVCCGEKDDGAGQLREGETDATLLPPSGSVGVWTRSAKTKFFSGAELYGHINGGAEIFLDLGFERLVVQKYSEADREITVDLYHMTDHAAALGIYLMKCGRETPAEVLQARHTVNRYQLLAVAGALFLTITDVDGAERSGATLVEFARRIVAAVAGEGDNDLFERLPSRNRITGSERIIRGQFTLQAVYTLGPGDILRLGGTVTALSARYRGDADETFTRIIADYPTAEAALGALSHVKENLDSYLVVIESSPERLLFKDHAERFGLVELDGARLDLFVGLSRKPE